MFEYLLKRSGGDFVLFLARRKVGGSKGYITLLGALCVMQPKLSDTVGGIYTCNTVK